MMRFLLFGSIYLLISVFSEASEIQFPYPSPAEFSLKASTSIKSVYEALRMNDLPASRQRLTHIRQTSAEIQEQSLANFYLCLLHLDLDQVDRAKRYLDALKRAPMDESVKNRAQALYDVRGLVLPQKAAMESGKKFIFIGITIRRQFRDQKLYLDDLLASNQIHAKRS